MEEQKRDLTYDIISERIDFGIELVKKLADKYKLDLSDKEIMENARNIGISMFIQKENKRR